MNETLKILILTYATQDHATLRQKIWELSKDTLAAALVDLLTIYMNDRNSSTLREMITTVKSGYQVIETKLGYNGYRQTAPDGPMEYCEVKPKNVRRPEGGGAVRERLKGGGNFSDYTPERFQKDLQQNPMMLVSGFVDGRLVYIIKFPFHCLESRLSDRLERKFPGGKREGNSFLRSADFDFSHYRDCAEVEIVYCADELIVFQDCLNHHFYEWLLEKSQG